MGHSRPKGFFVLGEIFRLNERPKVKTDVPVHHWDVLQEIKTIGQDFWVYVVTPDFDTRLQIQSYLKLDCFLSYEDFVLNNHFVLDGSPASFRRFQEHMKELDLDFFRSRYYPTINSTCKIVLDRLGVQEHRAGGVAYGL